jgi:hypothetical protein
VAITSQTLLIFNGKLVKKESNWLFNRVLYQKMFKASEKLLPEEKGGIKIPEFKDEEIKQGYLAMLLRLKRNFKNSVIKPLYGLESAWESLSALDDIFNEATPIVHVKLINLGLLIYYKVNTALLLSLSERKWTTLRSILNYYSNSRLVDFSLAERLLRNCPEIVEQIPQDLSCKLFNILSRGKHVRSPLALKN